MDSEKKFKRHVLQAVTAYKELLDTYCCNGYPANQLSAQFGIRRNVLQQGFKKIYGENIREYKLRKRMERSLELLREGKDVKAVASELNYSKTRAFTMAFKKFYGDNPTAYANLLK